MTEAITVSKLNSYIKRIFDAEELLHNIPVVGEVFGVSFSRNVIYFSLKDEEATLPCVCFYPAYANDIKEGDKLIVIGSPNFYVKGGKLNFNVSRVEKVGQGKLYEEFIKLKNQLEAEGLFAQSNKQPLPSNIKRIGVITSREGAVIQDIKNVAWRRNPSVDIVLFNTKVQGNMAENEIAHAIEMMDSYNDIDVIVVARGGGSLEDLWAYNTEIVARATFNCKKPIISAVGHETDFTIIDFVSDLRAPTPSAAAELLTYNIIDKKSELKSIANHLYMQSERYLQEKYNAVANSTVILNNIEEKLFTNNKHKLQTLSAKLLNSFDQKVNNQYYELGIIENTLNKINPINILNQGYAKVEQSDRAITSITELNKSQQFNVIFKDGKIAATVKGEKK